MVKDYDLGINYHPGKANVVVDALSRKPVSLNVMLESLPSKLKEEITQLNLVIAEAGLANILTITPILEEEIRKAQPGDAKLQKRIKSSDFSKDQYGTLQFRGRLCVGDITICVSRPGGAGLCKEDSPKRSPRPKHEDGGS